MTITLRNYAVFSLLFAILSIWTSCAPPVFAAVDGPACEVALAAEVGAYRSSVFTEPDDLAEKYHSVRAWIETAQGVSTQPFLSIVVPAYKEEVRIAASIRHIRTFLDQYPLPVEVLILVEKSPDQTLTVAQEAAENDPRIVVRDNIVQKGKGYAVRSGMQLATGKVALFMDADLSTPLYEIIRFLDWLRTHPGTDIIIGDRVKAIASVADSRSLLREVLTTGFRTAIHLASPLKFQDTQAGFKMFRRSVMEPIFSNQTINGFAFDVEILIIAKELGFKVDSVDIDWLDDRRSTVRPLIDPAKMLIDIIRVQTSVRHRLRAQWSGASQ